jgi:predicted acetyltransferase
MIDMKIEELGSEHEAAFLAMIKDFAGGDPESHQAFFARKQAWDGPAFQKFLKECQRQRQDWRPKAKTVSLTHYVMVAAGQPAILGYGRMRFPLDSVSEMDGGNLEVAIPPSRRKAGNGSLCLSLLLFEAVRAGLRRALVTCGSDDAAARKVIERNRGVLQDIVVSPHPERKNRKIARYWISFR